MKRLIILLLLILSSFSTHAQEMLTVEKAIATALENNYNIKIAQNNQAIAENNFTPGNAGFLPTLSANFNRTYGINSFEQTRANGDQISDDGVKTTRQNYGVDLNWTIFDGLRMFRSYDQLEEIATNSRASLRNEIEQLIFNVTMSFYEAALEKERLILSENNIALSEERLRIAKEKYELGKASKLEFLQAQVDLNSDKSAQIRQMETLSLRKLALLQQMAMPTDSVSFTLSYEVRNDTSIDLADVINKMETDNPQLLVLRRDQTIARYEKEITESDRLPQVNLFAGYNRSSSENPASFAIENRSGELSYGISASWTLFDGFNVNRRIQNAKIQMENTQYVYQDLLIALTTNVRSRYINYQNNLNLMELEQENVAVARENNEIAKDRYQIGLSNPVELREAQINLINAELRLQNAAFAAKLAEIELKFLSGEMNVGQER